MSSEVPVFSVQDTVRIMGTNEMMKRGLANQKGIVKVCDDQQNIHVQLLETGDIVKVPAHSMCHQQHAPE